MEIIESNKTTSIDNKIVNNDSDATVLKNMSRISNLKQEAKNIIDQISEVVRVIDPDHSILNECLSTQESFDEDQMIISVVGEFSRGKSCFLNSLLGEKVLKEADMPTTATITKLRYGEKPKMIVKFKDGKEKYIPEDNEPDIDPREFPTKLSDYTSELSKEFGGDKGKVSELIREVVCEYPNKVLKTGITIVDTPGVKALVSGHQEMTEEQVKKSNAAICLFSCDQVEGNAGEIEFLKFVKNEMGGNPDKLLYLANKIYKAQESVNKNQSDGRNYLEEKEFYIEKFRLTIQKHIGINKEEINIFGYDSEWSISQDENLKEKGGFYQVTNFIDQVLTSDKQLIASQLNDPLHRTQRLQNRAKEIVEKRLEQINNPQDLESLNKNLEEFKEKEDALKIQMESKVNNLITNLKQIKGSIDKRFNDEIVLAIKNFRTEDLGKLISSVTNKKDYEISLEKIKNFDHDIKEIIDDLLTNNFKKELENKLKEYGESVFGEISQMNYFNQDDINDLINQVNTELNLDNKFGYGELAEFEDLMNIFEKKKEETEQKIFELQNELPFKATQAEKINKQIQALEDQKRVYEFKIQSSSQPEPIQKKKVEYKDVPRQGILGYFFGEKWNYTVTEREEYFEYDDSNVTQFQDTMKDFNNKISSMNKQISDLRSNSIDLKVTDIEIQKNQRILDNLISKEKEAQKKIDAYWSTVRQRLDLEVPSRLNKLKNRLNNIKTNKIDKVLETVSKNISEITNQKIQSKLDDVTREISRLIDDKQKGEQDLEKNKNLIKGVANNLEKIDISINQLEQKITDLITKG